MPRSKSTLPRMPRKTKQGVKQQAYELLGIAEEDVLMVPKIEPLLRRALSEPVKKDAEGNELPTRDPIERVWSYLETSSDENARILIAQKYKLSTKSQRDAIPFEGYCVAAKLETKKVMGLIFSEVFSQNQQAAELMAASAQPEIVQATIEAATQPGGTREREMMHKHSRFVPVPQTSVTFVSKAGKVVQGDDRSQTLAVLPPIENTVRQLSDRFNERQLSAPVEDAEYMEVDEEEDGEE